jgi:triacylglycerol esterase/lipase EstA (alpha/beta hydrolase family)
MPLPTVILLGFFASASEYQSLEFALNQQGILTVTVPLGRGNGLPTLGGRSMAPILHSIERVVKQVLQQYNTDRVNLIGHSARGWSARIYLSSKINAKQ